MKKIKAYYLPLPVHRPTSWRTAIYFNLGHMGFEAKTQEEINASMYKAKASSYTHVKIPYERSMLSVFNERLQQVQEHGLKPLIQIDLEKIREEDLIHLPLGSEAEVFLPETAEEWRRLPLIQQRFAHIHYSLLAMKSNSINNFFHCFLKFANLITDLHLYCPFPLKQTPWDYLKCSDIPKLKNRLVEQLGLQVHPPLGENLWDPRVASHFELEPFYEPIFINRVPGSNIQVSVVIPSYNNRRYVRLCIEHLLRQNLSPLHYEVIVVDDGSTDGTQQELLDLFSQRSEYNLTLIYFPRVKPRQMGDGQFRAGIARNLGIKHAQGDILSFLDSDILVPKDYLQTVIEQLKTVDVLQARRFNLGKDISAEEVVRYEEVQAEHFIPDEPYWEKFNQLASWTSVEHPWKYVCTHSLSIRKETLKKVGGFKNCFIFYGFEDTDFGYRLYKQGYRFHLLDTKVYHLFHKTNRSEFYNSNSLRHQVLGQTARIFYRNHLADEIYQILGGYLMFEESIRPTREQQKYLRQL